MSNEEARGVVGRRTSANNANGEGAADNGVTGEWGEKVERVWEFLVEAGGLRGLNDDDEQVAENGQDVRMILEVPMENATLPINESDRPVNGN